MSALRVMRIVALFPLVVALVAFAVHAQSPPSQPLDAIVVLYNSSSMQSNDPQKLITRAVTTIGQKFVSDSRLGIACRRRWHG